MKESLAAGLTTTTRIIVDDSRTISFMGDDGRVYATPELVRDIELTCRELLLEQIDEGQDSVGTHIDVSHIAATPISMWVDITVTVKTLDGRVYATPELVRDIEMTCRDLLLEQIDEGQDSVGTHIDVSHIAATPIGMWVDISVTVKTIDGRAISFEISARDPLEQICRGSHTRFIVDMAKTFARLKGKIDAVAAA